MDLFGALKNEIVSPALGRASTSMLPDITPSADGAEVNIEKSMSMRMSGISL
jgi:hypothetical protein